MEDLENLRKLAVDEVAELDAVFVSSKRPFIWAWNIESPIYCDLRQIVSLPSVRNTVVAGLQSLIENAFGLPDVIGGVGVAGIPFASILAERLELPVIYTRAQRKDHGLERAWEGRLTEGQRVILIEDVISTGWTALNACKAIRSGGGNVVGVATILDYGIHGVHPNFLRRELKLESLFLLEDLLAACVHSGKLDRDTVSWLFEWRDSFTVPL